MVEMRYDNAWGGLDDSDPAKVLVEPRNPVGKGITRDPSSLTDQVAPSIEDPMNLIKSYRTRPPPAGIGPIGRSYEPRVRYAGTYDQQWQEYRAPLLPDDFDDRFNLCASPGLVSDVPLRGGEEVRLLSLVPGGGARACALPRVGVEIEMRVKGREPAIVTPHLDTVLIDCIDVGPDRPLTVEMVWRAYVNAPRRVRDSRVIVREAE
jgi:hypothetical protein